MGKQAKMTPGPWKAIGVGIYVDDAEDHEIAAIACTGLSRPIRENEANARAIACLPELVEAARRLIGATGVPEREAVRRILARIEGKRDGDNLS